METFTLASLDWSSIHILGSAHLQAETAYQEESLRCALHFAGLWGVAQMNAGDLEMSGSTSRDYQIRLRACHAITPGGYLIYLPAERGRDISLAVRADSLAQGGAVVPLYLSVTAQKTSTARTPAHSRALAECRFLQWNYALTTDPAPSGSMDVVQIGRLKREGSEWMLDTAYIPECLLLDSHTRLREQTEIIQNKARRCLQSVQAQIQREPSGMGVLAAILAPAATRVDTQARPRAYLERMAGILTALRAVHTLIPASGAHDVAHFVEEALGYLEGHGRERALDWAVALASIATSFDELEGALRGRSGGTDRNASKPPTTPHPALPVVQLPLPWSK